MNDTMDNTTRNVRHQLFQFYLRECRPPTTDELAKASGMNVSEIPAILKKLEDLHHIVLYKHECAPTPIAMAHPFSHLPTSVVVSSGPRTWWANCTWCALGLASMLSPAESTVSIRSGSIGTQLQFVIQGDEVKCFTPQGEINASDCCVHFSVPPSTWWRDVRFACGTIQVFASRQEAHEWPAKRGFHSGDIISLETAWALSKEWYHDKHEHGYNRKSAEEVKELYTRLGMTSDFWSS
ncbi:alkylmercury lyase family protein [Aspergillus lucknowensis]|uniref:Alkylmercury lyase-domain-containing protein n=1 Tax=Aspergillus lucknowensis TaxID=176173 RepID=A0ABR4LCG5_9EURO